MTSWPPHTATSSSRDEGLFDLERPHLLVPSKCFEQVLNVSGLDPHLGRHAHEVRLLVDPDLFELQPTPRQEGIELVRADRVRDRQADDLRMGTEAFALQVSVRNYNGPHHPIVYEGEVGQARAGGHTQLSHRPGSG